MVLRQITLKVAGMHSSIVYPDLAPVKTCTILIFIRQKFIDAAADNFLETLRLMGSVYKPPDELLSQPAAAVAQPQAVAND